MKTDKFLIFVFVFCATMVFIANIFQPLSRWVVGTWIFFAGYNAVLYIIEKGKLERKE